MTLFFYVLREVVPQFFTALCVLSAVIVISQMIRLSEVLVTFGLTPENLLLPFLFILVPFLAFTIPMAWMFAVLLTFSRISADGEYAAMLASGYSLRRACVAPLMGAVVLYFIAAFCALNFEPWGRRETVQFYHRKTQTQLDNMIRVQLKPGVFLNDFLGYVLYSEKISADRSRFENVLLSPGKNLKNQNFTLLAPSGSIMGSVEEGNLRMSFDYGIIYSIDSVKDDIGIVKFKRAELDILRIFQDQIFGEDLAKDDYRSYPPGRLWTYTSEIRDSKDPQVHMDYLKARFLLHQRIGTPFVIIAFTMFAMILGIQDERRGKSHGYTWSILTIIITYIFTMGFKYLAERDWLPAPMAVWIPNLLMLGFGSFLVYQRNRLPPSESTLDRRYIPWLRRFARQPGRKSAGGIRST